MKYFQPPKGRSLILLKTAWFLPIFPLFLGFQKYIFPTPWQLGPPFIKIWKFFQPPSPRLFQPPFIWHLTVSVWNIAEIFLNPWKQFNPVNSRPVSYFWDVSDCLQILFWQSKKTPKYAIMYLPCLPGQDLGVTETIDIITWS